jgi:hypothetical protein
LVGLSETSVFDSLPEKDVLEKRLVHRPPLASTQHSTTLRL